MTRPSSGQVPGEETTAAAVADLIVRYRVVTGESGFFHELVRLVDQRTAQELRDASQRFAQEAVERDDATVAGRVDEWTRGVGAGYEAASEDLRARADELEAKS